MKGTGLAWLAFIGATTYRWETDPANTATLPPPSLYVGSAVIYSLLGIAAGSAPQPAALFGWALVVAAITTGLLVPPITSSAGGVAKAPAPSQPQTRYAPGQRRIAPAN